MVKWIIGVDMDEDELYNLFEDTMKELDKQFLPNEETPTGDRENECIKFI